MVPSVKNEAPEHPRSAIALDREIEDEFEAMPNFLDMTKEEIIIWINNNKTGTSKVGAISKAQKAQFSKYAQDVFMKSFENTFETPKVCLSCSI